MYADVLVDSSYYIDRLRAGEDPFEEFDRHADETDFLICGVVETEVLRGVKSRKARDRMKALMDVMIYVPTSNSIWEKVMKLAWELDRKGQWMQVTDLVIAVCALEANAYVLTLDSDFDRVPGLRVLRSLP